MLLPCLKTTQDPEARAMAKRSVKARKEAWGEEEFDRRMREIGKLGGRPKGSTRKGQA